MSRVDQTAEKDSKRCRKLVKPLRKKVSGVEATGKSPEQRKAGDQTSGLKYRQRKAGGKTSRLKYRRRKAGDQTSGAKCRRQSFRVKMSAAHRRFREIKTPAMHIPVKMIKAILITRIKISGDASAREASPMQQVTMIVTITILMV